MISRSFFYALAMAFLGLGINSFAMDIEDNVFEHELDTSSDNTRYKFDSLDFDMQENILDKYNTISARTTNLFRYLKAQEKCNDMEYILPIQKSTREKLIELSRASIFLLSFMQGKYLDNNGMARLVQILTDRHL